MPDSTLSESLTPQDRYLISYAKRHLGASLASVVDLQTGEITAPARPPGREEAGRGGRALTSAHISPDGLVELWLGGGLISAHKGHGELKQCGGGRRGSVTAMSRASRRRLLRKIATTRRDSLPLFVGLTYDDNFPKNPKRWKRDLDCLSKRMTRKGWGAIWRIEYRARQTGDNMGQVAPHFHMLVWGADLAAFSAWLSVAWHEITGAQDPAHLVHGANVQAVRSWRGVMSYTSKYISKLDEDAIPEGCGRMWGCINSDAIPWAELLEVTAANPQVNQLFRYLRRYAHMGMRSGALSMTVLCGSPERWRDCLAFT